MNSGDSINIGFCVAYDWEFLKNSLPLVYADADRICLSIDKDRISWSGQVYEFDNDAFYAFVRKIDHRGIIEIYEDDFHQPSLTAMQNEVRQRNLIAARLGKGGWHIQLDTDEYFVDFRGFTNFLKRFRSNRIVNICCPWYTMFKQTDNGWFFIREKANEPEYIPVATKHPHYDYGRRNGYFNIKTPFVLLHQSWARREEEIRQKISNWGHKDDFDVSSYFLRWKHLDKSNYRDYHNFHPIEPSNWSSLDLRPGNDLNQLLLELRSNPPFLISARSLRRHNSIWRSRLRSLLSKLGL